MPEFTKHERLNFALISANLTLRGFAAGLEVTDRFVIAVVKGEKTSKRVMDAIDSLIKAESEKVKKAL